MRSLQFYDKLLQRHHTGNILSYTITMSDAGKSTTGGDDIDTPAGKTTTNPVPDSNLDPPKGVGERKSSRHGKVTAKSIEFRVKTTISFMKTTRNRLTKQTKIVDALLRGANTESVNNEMVALERTYVEISDAYARSCGMFQEEDSDVTGHEEIVKLMEETDNIYMGCKEKVCTFLLEQESNNEENKSTHSHGS